MLKGDIHGQYTLQVVTDRQEKLQTVKKTLEVTTNCQKTLKVVKHLRRCYKTFNTVTKTLQVDKNR